MAAPPSIARTRLFGLDFVSDSSIPALAALLTDHRYRPASPWSLLATPNVDHIVRYSKDPVERRVAHDADWLLPDGMPIIWASRLFRRPLRSRLAGSDLFEALWQIWCERAEPVVLVVANQELADRLHAEHPACRCVVPGIFDATDGTAISAIADVVEREVHETGARYVMLGVSMPKHHRLGAELARRPIPPAGSALVLLLGASAEFHAGMQRRAPRWMQRIGIEWLHRLGSDPRRMAKRYLVDDMTFFRLVWQEWRRGRA